MTNRVLPLQADIAAKTAELGGVHKYDLTPDCTHLIVGDYDTPKYRHVAKERPDVRAMAIGWVEAVRNLWIQDAEIDFLALEKEWQLRTFETGGGELPRDGTEPERRKLLCCMTGFDDSDTRQQIMEKIQSNGGVYTGDLTKRVTHLIVYKPEGRKYQAAKTWGVQTVAIEWVDDSIERGLILDEKCYDPILPKEERGNAWNKQRPRVSSLGKRLRENSAVQEEGKRKLRKTASMKLNSQRDNLWGDILGKPQTGETSLSVTSHLAPTNGAAPTPTVPLRPPSGAPKSMDTQGSKLSSFGAPHESSVFASCCFYVHGFSAQKTEILVNTVASLGGLICHSLDEVVSTSGAQMSHRFLIIPQTSAPETHPRLPDNVHIITEFYIERCLHKKYFFDPSSHVVGRPFPLFPIPGFEDLTICTAGFTGVDLNQIDKSIRQLGGKYEERFTANVSLLVCLSLSVVRKQKLELALAWKVPVVSADWLWECISTGFNAPIKQYLFPELKQKVDSPKSIGQGKEREIDKDTGKGKQKPSSSKGAIDQDLLPKPSAKTKHRYDLDKSAFKPAREENKNPNASSTQIRRNPQTAEHGSNVTGVTHFETALTHIFPTDDANISFKTKSFHSAAPLSEVSFNSLNKSPTSSKKQDTQRPRKPMSRITSEVADSEATDDDIGHPNDIPLVENEDQNAPHWDRNPTGQNQQKDLQVAKQRLEAEERLAISHKLVSLLDSAATKLATATAPDTVTTTTTANPSTAPAAAANSNEIPDDPTRPKRRKREILGRAISNVSVASSTSGAENQIHHDAAPSIKKADAPQPPPASTQLEYGDPEGKRSRAALLGMIKGNAGGTDGVEEERLQQQQQKLRLTEMYDMAAMQQLRDGGRFGEVVGSKKRITRQKP